MSRPLNWGGKKVGKMRETTLTRFIRDECANYAKHYQECLSDSECKVLSGERCGYFEKCVLGPPDYPYRLPGYDFAKLFAQYAEQTGARKQSVRIRRCGCGTPLRHRQRYCDSCAMKRRRKTKRDSQRRYRQVRVA